MGFAHAINNGLHFFLLGLQPVCSVPRSGRHKATSYGDGKLIREKLCRFRNSPAAQFVFEVRRISSVVDFEAQSVKHSIDIWEYNERFRPENGPSPYIQAYCSTCRLFICSNQPSSEVERYGLRRTLNLSPLRCTILLQPVHRQWKVPLSALGL